MGANAAQLALLLIPIHRETWRILMQLVPFWIPQMLPIVVNGTLRRGNASTLDAWDCNVRKDWLVHAHSMPALANSTI